MVENAWLAEPLLELVRSQAAETVSFCMFPTARSKRKQVQPHFHQFNKFWKMRPSEIVVYHVSLKTETKTFGQ